jgi:coenzyme Q-binding protein COQ10
MPKASVKRLIECNKEQLVDLVLDIESYPKFIPYCLDAKIMKKKKKKI